LLSLAADILSWMKNDGVGDCVYSPTYVTSYEREVCTSGSYVSSLRTQQIKPANGSGAQGFHHKGH